MGFRVITMINSKSSDINAIISSYFCCTLSSPLMKTQIMRESYSENVRIRGADIMNYENQQINIKQ